MPVPGTEARGEQQARQVRDWRTRELRRLGFSRQQRERLLERMEAGELLLEDVRRLVAAGCPAATAYKIAR